jgi:hypothetical protein
MGLLLRLCAFLILLPLRLVFKAPAITGIGVLALIGAGGWAGYQSLKPVPAIDADYGAGDEQLRAMLD